MSRGEANAFLNDSGVPCRDAKEGKGRSIRETSSLFPIPEGVNADSHSLGELSLGHCEVFTEQSDVFSRLERSMKKSPVSPCWNGSGEVLGGKFLFGLHDFPAMCFSKS